VANYRVLNKRTFVAGVSGGVWCDVRDVMAKDRDVETKRGGDLDYARESTIPKDSRIWWWDAK
jgi:hypothetical protein